MIENKVAAGARFTPITMAEVELFLKRGFRALKPTKITRNGEYCFKLMMSDNVHILVWTSIHVGTDQGAGKGVDPMRIGLYEDGGRPLMKGKLEIVKRTQNWRDSLQDRIEELMETYDDREEYWEQRAQWKPGQ